MSRGARCFVLFCVALIGSVASFSLRAEVFTLYTYHDKPPYYHNQNAQAHEQSIYEDFVAYLNEKQKELKVELFFKPRKRLENQLKEGQLNGGIIGVNPLWFDDQEKKKFLWSSAFMLDKDVVVTQKGNLFAYRHPNDLVGLRLALSRGLYYWGITELAVNKKIIVYETGSDVQNLEMVLLGRVDATITSMLTFNYFSKNKFSPADFSVLETPHDQYERMVLIPQHYERAHHTLESIIRKASDDPEWQNRLKNYF